MTVRVREYTIKNHSEKGRTAKRRHPRANGNLIFRKTKIAKTHFNRKRMLKLDAFTRIYMVKINSEKGRTAKPQPRQ